MNQLKSLLGIAFLLFVFSAEAQFEIKGLIRPRAEFRDGYKKLRTESSSPAAFVSQRSRLSMYYKNENISTGLTLFDSRVWGDQVWKKDISSVGIHEAWAEIGLSGSSSVKFGRQELKYDNSRLFSPVNWNQTGAAHDAVLFKFKKSGWAMDLGVAWNQSAQKTFGTDYAEYKKFYKNLNFLWLSKKMGKLTISTLDILDGYQDETDVESINYRYTTGLIFDYKPGKFRTTTRAFYQGGKLQDKTEIRAYYLNTDFNYKLSEKIDISAGFELMSGNDGKDSLSTTSKVFDIIYGGRHKFNGRMDYFSTPVTTKGAGLFDPYLKLNCKLGKSTSILTEYHYFMLQNDYLNNGSAIDKFLGQEVDFTLSKRILKDVALSAGYSMMFGGKSMEVIKGGDRSLFNQWAFVMISVNPTFFSNL